MGFDGPISQTTAGTPCITWNSVKESGTNPNFAGYEPQLGKTKGIYHNQCRNPDNSPRPWCFTTVQRTSGANWAYCYTTPQWNSLSECAPVLGAGLLKTDKDSA